METSEKTKREGTKVWKVVRAFLTKYRYFFAKLGISLLTLALSVILLFFLQSSMHT